MATVPILDIAEFLRTNVATGDDSCPESLSVGAQQFVQHLRDACHGSGFVYLTGHGIARELEAAMLAAAAEFFALPEAQRREIEIVQSRHFRGYTVLGGERTAGKQDWRDQIDIGPEEVAPTLATGDPAWQRLRGPNQWPAQVPALKASVLAWQSAMAPFGMAVLRALALGLEQPAGCFDTAMLPDPYTRIKVMRYPAQHRPPEPVASETNFAQGLGLHHDSGLLSFVLQSDVAGLQVQTTGGELVDVPPVPGSYVMNLGEMMQAASDGYYRATAHRVVSPMVGARQSIAYFFNPRLAAHFEPVDLPVHLAQHATGAANRDPSDPVHATFGENTLKIRLRAHPDVAARHYADVLAPTQG